MGDLFYPLLLVAIPYGLHVGGILFDKLETLDSQWLHLKLINDERDHVKRPFQKDSKLLPAVTTFFDFIREVHLILSMILFCIISLSVTIIEKYSNNHPILLSDWLESLMSIIILLLLAAAFLLRVNKLEPSTVDSTRWWRRVTYIAVLSTAFIIINLQLHLVHLLPSEKIIDANSIEHQ